MVVGANLITLLRKKGSEGALHWICMLWKSVVFYFWAGSYKQLLQSLDGILSSACGVSAWSRSMSYFGDTC